MLKYHVVDCILSTRVYKTQRKIFDIARRYYIVKIKPINVSYFPLKAIYTFIHTLLFHISYVLLFHTYTLFNGLIW